MEAYIAVLARYYETRLLVILPIELLPIPVQKHA